MTCQITLVALLMAGLARGTAQYSQLGFLNKLVGRIHREQPIETVLVLQHNEDTNCVLQGWNRPEFPTLRSNQLGRVDVRKNFNYRSLGLVCICRDSDMSLLDTLAEDFSNIRKARIILLAQTIIDGELFQVITNKVEEYQFLRMLILELRDETKKEASVLRLDPFPRPKFDRIDNILGMKESIFFSSELNYKGRITYLRPDWEGAVRFYIQLPSNRTIPLTHMQDAAIVEFAFKYNVSLRVLSSSNISVVPDIRFRTQVLTNTSNIKSIGPYDITSLMLVVPCAREWRFGEVLGRMDIRSLLLHVISVYGIFVAAETFILVVTYRISGQAYALTTLNPLVNLRAFRAILGMPFPISHRASLSLRQLALAISVFGLVFSSFISCKLSALLTKRPHHPQVSSFEELRTSGLPIISGVVHRRLIEGDFAAECNLPQIVYLPQAKTAQMILDLNYSNAYFMLSESWEVVDNYQKSFGLKTLCESKDLTIIHGLPMLYELKKNSIFDKPLFRFMLRLREAGIVDSWIRDSSYYLRKTYNPTIYRSNERMDGPLSVSHLKWVWCVLGLGHGLALITFIIEMLLGGRRRSRRTLHVSVA